MSYFPPRSIQREAQALHVADFTGDTNTGHFRHGRFWLPGTNLTEYFFWEAWVMPRNSGSRYLISDGHGGVHALLAGFTQIGAGQENIPSGNVYTGVTSGGFSGETGDGVMPGEWAHVAWAWGPDASDSNAKKLWVFVNGIPVGVSSFTGPRQSPAIVADGGGGLYIGGSHHNNFDGRLAMMRAFEGSFPLAYGQRGFAPDNAFTPESYDGGTGFTDAAFLACYTVPNQVIIPDHAPVGYDGGDGVSVKRRHPGALFGGSVARGMPNSDLGSFPRPTWVADSTCPVGSAVRIIPTLDIPSPVRPVPVGAIVFDSFDKTQSNHAWVTSPSLGSTNASASGGAKAWSTSVPTAQGSSASHFGIRRGRAIIANSTIAAAAYVDAGQANADVRVSRLVGSYGVVFTSLVFRYQDRDNFWFAYNVPGLPNSIRVGGFNAGSYTEPSNGDSTPAFNGYDASGVSNWSRLRVVTSGTTFTIYVGIESGAFDANNFPLFTWTQIGQLTSQTHLQSATKFGLAGIPYNATVITAMMRWDDFEIR